ncbi:MAG: glycosyltransferase [Candidatus Mcinerneyibacterium aminivorans]|uniref:Glycosyltransferase n=1 Tax=Candidatus Mcinerneyibacterium aminivorans TaxID=2703815 RepID=A0A5D0MFS5_9BACT|nr:MAG: glycosyltransferase [Candidatus Mcinerneyibacterium aminivorans]
MNNKAKFTLVGGLIVIAIIISYRIYAPTTIQDFKTVNLKGIEKVKDLINEKDSFKFAVLGNIKNSITIFDKKILPKIRKENVDFIVSTGNNLTDSGEGKYRVFYRTLSKMQTPFITGVGENEVKDEGYKNYYKYFGPFYFSFHLKNLYFIFLDTTGHSPTAWQKTWLEKELKESKNYARCFVIMNKPPVEVKIDYLIEDEDYKKYISDVEDRKYYQELFSKFNVEAVFTSNLQIYRKKKINDILYFITGGAGGTMILDNPNSFYHYLVVEVSSKNVNYSIKKVERGFELLNSDIAKALENVWIFLQSFLFTNYTTVLLILTIVFLVGFILYLELRRTVDYYREFGKTGKDIKSKKLKVAIFTSNYFPFIGGVPISISRLKKGLEKLGHEVYIFAPEYPDYRDKDEHIIRCKTLLHNRKNGMEFPVVNIFSKDIKKEFLKRDFDIVHAHHPYWLGAKGLALAEKNDLPRVFTYHTRLEKYSHYLPSFLFFRKLFENRIAHYIINRAGNRSDAVIAPTESAKEYLFNIGVSRYIRVLPTGVDFEDYEISSNKINEIKKKHKNNDEVLLLSVSRLSREKNMYFLFRGLKHIRETTDINFKCLIIGDGSEKENLQRYIAENNLEGYIELLGSIDHKEISKYYMISDLFVFASKSETQGMVLLEAMAGKTPVVAVRSSGIDDVIKDRHNGYKVEENITVWTEKVVRLIKDKQLRRKMTENAYKFASDHSIEKMAEKTAEVYYKTINYER